jgi:alpha-L-fucosidase
MFKAEHFDPAAWAELFKKSGVKYVVPVAEHHDGFAMYDSGISDWTAAKMGPHRDVLLAVGGWLNVNGEAIYGTRPWRIYGEGPTKVAAGSFHDTHTANYTAEDFRFTTKGDVLYAIGLAWPANGKAVISSLAQTAGSERVRAVVLLGNEAKLRFEERPDALHVQLPAQPPG